MATLPPSAAEMECSWFSSHDPMLVLALGADRPPCLYRSTERLVEGAWLGCQRVPIKHGVSSSLEAARPIFGAITDCQSHD